MIVETKIVGAKDTESRDVPLPSRIGTLREVLEALVRHEVAAYEQRRAASKTLQVLTPADLVAGAQTGAYGREVRAVPAAPTEQVAIDRAIEAFTDGLYFVFIDGTQQQELDEPLRLTPESTLRLVRLVALAGG